MDDKSDSTCSASYGYTAGHIHRVNLIADKKCYVPRITIQKFLHVFGLLNEHQRPDRDDYVWIDFENIVPKFRGNFEKCNTCKTYNVPYDPKSIMHYRAKDFCADCSKLVIHSKVIERHYFDLH